MVRPGEVQEVHLSACPHQPHLHQPQGWSLTPLLNWKLQVDKPSLLIFGHIGTMLGFRVANSFPYGTWSHSAGSNGLSLLAST